MSNEPVAWGMPRPDGQIVDVITPEEHTREEGGYTVPLYAQDDTALLRQALEALKNSRGYIVAEYEQRKALYEGYPHMAYKYQAEANDLASIDALITTLKERLGEKT